jgi:hypothetical protein
MTATHKIKVSSIIAIIGLPLIAIFLGFFGKGPIIEIVKNSNDPSETIREQIVCDTSSLLNEVPSGIVLAGPLNLRTGPGLNFDVTSKLEICTQIKLTGRSIDNTWLEVKLPNKEKGWVFSPYIQANINIIDLEVKTTISEPNDNNPSSGSNNGRNASVIIEGNRAVAFVNGMPANKEITAVLSPSNNSNNSLVVAVDKTDEKGNVTLTFSMPTTWPDGITLTSGTMTLAFSAGSETQTILLTYYAN